MQYTKKPITIEAIQFAGTWESMVEIQGMFPAMEVDGMFLEEDKKTVPWFGIKTLEGTHRCIPQDFVIQGIKGEYYPCKPDIFIASYIRTSLIGAVNKVPRNLMKGLNALRLEVDESIVKSLIEIAEKEFSAVEITNYEENIPLTLHGFPVGNWQMLSVRGNLLVEPIFHPIEGSNVGVNASTNTELQ